MHLSSVPLSSCFIRPSSSNGASTWGNLVLLFTLPQSRSVTSKRQSSYLFQGPSALFTGWDKTKQHITMKGSTWLVSTLYSFVDSDAKMTLDQNHNQDQTYLPKFMCVTLLQVLQINQQIKVSWTKKRIWLCSGLFIPLKMNRGVENLEIVFNPAIFSLIGISFPSLWKSETWCDRTHFPKVPRNQRQRQLNYWIHLTLSFSFFHPTLRKIYDGTQIAVSSIISWIIWKYMVLAPIYNANNTMRVWASFSWHSVMV